MKKMLKLLAYLCGTLLLLLATAVIVIKVYLPPEKIRELVLEYAGARLNREIKIGAVSVGLKGISIEDVVVSEYPDFSKGEFLKAKKFQASLRWKPLLQKRIEINSIRVTGISLHLKRQKHDVYNFSDLISPSKPAPPAKEPSRKDISISISALSIEDSQIIYTDSVLPLKLKVMNMQMKASNISAGKPFSLQFESAITVKSAYFASGTRPIPVKVELSMDLAGGDMKKAFVKIKNLHISWDQFSAKMSGSAVNLPAPEVSLRLNVKPFSSSALKKWFPALPKNIPFPGISVESVFKMLKDSVNINSLSVKAGPVNATLEGKVRWAPKIDYMLKTKFEATFPEMDSKNIARHFPKIPKNLKIPAMQFSGRADLSPEKTRVQSFRVKLGEIIASGSGDITFTRSGPEADVLVKLESASLGEIAGIVPMLGSYGLGGTISARQHFRYSKKAGIDYSGTIKLSKIKASYSGYKFTEIAGPVAFSTSKVTAGPLSGKLDGAKLKASFSAANLQKTPQITFDVELERIDLAGLPGQAQSKAPGAPGREKKISKDQSSLPAVSLSGKAAIGELTHPNFSGKNISFDCNLKDMTPGMEKITGKASFAVRGGHLKDLSAIARDSAVGKVLLMPVILLQKVSRVGKVKILPNFDNISYSLMKGKYDFQKGNMKILESRMDSSVANVNMSGSVNLTTERLNVKIQTKLLAASGVKVARPIGMTVKGTLSDPSVRLDIKSIIKQPEVEKVLEKGIEKGKKLLLNLFK